MVTKFEGKALVAGLKKTDFFAASLRAVELGIRP